MMSGLHTVNTRMHNYECYESVELDVWAACDAGLPGTVKRLTVSGGLFSLRHTKWNEVERVRVRIPSRHPPPSSAVSTIQTPLTRGVPGGRSATGQGRFLTDMGARISPEGHPDRECSEVSTRDAA